MLGKVDFLARRHVGPVASTAAAWEAVIAGGATLGGAPQWDSTGEGPVVKPTFLIMGAQKGGTTSLYGAVRKHPMVGRAAKKEVHFFDRHYERGMQWYEQQFPLQPHESQIGEATPVYMYDPEVRDRVAENLPGIKIVITLRDPVARAYSHYWHSRRYSREKLPAFEDAVAAEPKRLAAAPQKKRAWWSYVDRGRYIDQLEALEKFYGRDAICVVTLEEVTTDTEAQLSRVLEHLGLDPDRMPDFELPRRNPYSEMRPKRIRELRASGQRLAPEEFATAYPKIDPATRARLMAGYAEYDARLAAWLGRPLPWQTAAP